MELVEADVADAIELPPGVGDDFGLVSLTELASAVGAEAAVAENHGPAEEDMLMEQDHQQEQDQEQEEEEMHRQREEGMEADQGGEIIHGEGNEFDALSQGARRGAGANEVKSNDDSTQLLLTRRKVMEQAKELLELAEELEQSQDYASLCEQRICELRPGHPIPVTRSCLGVAATPALARSRGTVETRGTPSHILSEKARSKRHALDAAASHNKLEKQFRASQAKLREACELVLKGLLRSFVAVQIHSALQVGEFTMPTAMPDWNVLCSLALSNLCDKTNDISTNRHAIAETSQGR